MKKIKSEELDRMFDAGEDMTQYMVAGSVRKVAKTEMKKAKGILNSQNKQPLAVVVEARGCDAEPA